MMRQKDSTTYPIQFLMVDDGDHITGLTLLTPTVTISKNGGGFGAAAGAVSELANGVYSWAADATDRNTLGELMVHISASGADPVDLKVLIVDFDPFTAVGAILDDTGSSGVAIASGQTITNLTNLPTMPADWITASGLKTDAITKIQNGLALEATLAAIKGAGWTDENLTTIDANVDAILADTGTDGVVLKAAGLATDAITEIVGGVWGSKLNDYTSIDEAGGEILTAIGNVAAIKAKTDNLPADPADESSLEAAIAAVPTLDAAGVRTAVGLASANLDTQLSGIQADLDNTDQYKADVSGLATSAALATVDSNVDAIKAKTDNLPTDPADQSILAGAIAALPLASDYTPARAAKLDYLDAAISSRATSGEGTISWTYTLTASDNVTPIAYATVWVTSDAAGTAIEASGQTDAAGQVTFMLNAGTYYVWRKKRGYRFQNPDIEVVV